MNRWIITAGVVLAAMLAARTPVRADDALDAAKLFAVGARLYEAGQWQEARLAFDRAANGAEGATADAAALYAAECLAQLGEYSAASLRLERLIADRGAAEPYRTQAFFRAGEAAWMLGAGDLARRRLEQFLLATDEGPLSKFARDYLAEIDSADANALRARSQREWRRLMDEAESRLAAGHDDAAIGSLMRAADVATGPEQRTESLRRAGQLHERLGQFREARTSYEQTLADEPKSPHAPATRLALARALLRQGAGPAAVRQLEKLVDDSPDSADAVEAAYLLANRDLDEGNLIRARSRLVAATSRLEGRAGTERLRDLAVAMRLLRGQVEMAAQDWPAARAALTDALVGANDADQATARFWLAEIDYQLGEFDAALARYVAVAVAIDKSADVAVLPLARTVPLRIAQIYASRGQWPDVLDMTAELRGMPLDWPARGEVDFLEGQAQDARHEFRAAQAAYQTVLDDPQSAGSELAARAEFMLGESYFRQRNVDAARRTYDHLLASASHAEWQARAALQAGKCCELAGQFVAARELYADGAIRFAATRAGGQLRARTEWIDRVALASDDWAPRNARAPRN